MLVLAMVEMVGMAPLAVMGAAVRVDLQSALSAKSLLL